MLLWVVLGFVGFAVGCMVWGFVTHDPPPCGAAPPELMAAEPPLDAAQRFAVAVGAPLAAQRRDGLGALRPDHGEDCLRGVLEDDWGVRSADDARDRLRWLLEEGGHQARLDALLAGELDDADPAERRFLEARPGVESIQGFDLVRGVCVARWAFGLGHLGRDEAWEWIFEAARQARARFGSWEELGESYLLGRELWKGAEEPEVTALVRRLFGRGAGSCRADLPWETPLSA